MSFDTDSKEKFKRYLLKHNESDCIFECFSENEANQYLDQCDDVTDITEWEFLFKRQKEMN